MCGISGFQGVSRGKRSALAMALGVGIDSRGGDACGYVGLSDAGTLMTNRKLGTWSRAKGWRQHIETLDAVVQHARFATHANAMRVNCAHPFPVRRAGRAVLWGVHNGIVDAEGSASEAGRPYSVDSLEVFERIADRDFDAVRGMPGYGVLSWIERGIPGVHLVRATDDGSLSVCKTVCGAIVWASTDAILFAALRMSNMRAVEVYELEVGRVATVSSGRIVYRPGYPSVTFKKRTCVTRYYRPSWDGMTFAGEDDGDDWKHWDAMALKMYGGT